MQHKKRKTHIRSPLDPTAKAVGFRGSFSVSPREDSTLVGKSAAARSDSIRLTGFDLLVELLELRIVRIVAGRNDGVYVGLGSVADRCKYLLRIHLTFNVRGHWDKFAVAIRAPWRQGSGHGSPLLTTSPTLSSTLVRR
jgi:hypothetical protein